MEIELISLVVGADRSIGSISIVDNFLFWYFLRFWFLGSIQIQSRVPWKQQLLLPEPVLAYAGPESKDLSSLDSSGFEAGCFGLESLL